MNIREQLAEYFSTKRDVSHGMSAASHVLRNAADAEDALQDAAVLALTTKHPFEYKSSFRTWFYRVVFNRSLINLRKETGNYNGKKREFIPLSDNFLDQSAPPDEQLLASEVRNIVLEEVSTMPSDLEREAVFLRFYEHMSYKELRAHLNVSNPAMKTRLVRAKKHLRLNLAERLHVQ